MSPQVQQGPEGLLPGLRVMVPEILGSCCTRREVLAGGDRRVDGEPGLLAEPHLPWEVLHTAGTSGVQAKDKS